LSTRLFSYIIAYKVTTQYTPYQLMYGLQPLMPRKYIVLVASGNDKDSTSMKVLTSKITKPEKLQEDRMQAVETTSI
jgi:hypothetical protein